MNLLDLPDCMLEQIFEYLTYDEIAKKRLVSKRINTICQSLLNRGFTKMMKRHTNYLKKIKAQLPRRESERRNHPLARHADILTCIETRISMLLMTYSKYMDFNLCCFIPGKVIDEVLNILKLVENTGKPLRAHEVLQELRDISSMAIEHFDEKISCLLKKSFVDIHTQKFPFNGSSEIINDPILENRDNDIREDHHCKEARANRLIISRMEKKLSIVMKRMQVQTQIQKKQVNLMRSHFLQITDLKRRLEESDAKNRDITANINQITLDNNTTATTTSSTSTDPAVKTKNIKPRTATIILKRRIGQTVASSTETNSDIKPSKMPKTYDI